MISRVRTLAASVSHPEKKRVTGYCRIAKIYTSTKSGVSWNPALLKMIKMY
jgi:hypothetical protein